MDDFWPRLGFLVLGAVICQITIAIRNSWSSPKRKLSCSPFYCPFNDHTELVFLIHNCGNCTVKDIKMRFQCASDDRILGYNFFVDEQIKCDRLDNDTRRQRKESNHSFVSTWDYMNRGDGIKLVVKVHPCESPEQARLEIDGEEFFVKHKQMKMRCDL